VYGDLKFTFTLLGALTIFMFIYFGLMVGLATVFVSELVTVLVIVAMIIDVMNMQDELLDSEAKIAALTLGYYRIQQIPTCVRPVAVGAGGGGADGEKAWWDKVWDSLWGH
jgi:hypothetical protein